MIQSGTLLSSAAFILFVITNILIFLLLARNIARLTVSFCVLLCLNYILWTIHGYGAKDVALMCSSGFGILTSTAILGTLIYNKLKAGK